VNSFNSALCLSFRPDAVASAALDHVQREPRAELQDVGRPGHVGPQLARAGRLPVDRGLDTRIHPHGRLATAQLEHAGAGGGRAGGQDDAVAGIGPEGVGAVLEPEQPHDLEPAAVALEARLALRAPRLDLRAVGGIGRAGGRRGDPREAEQRDDGPLHHPGPV
jgi:hypothetical protein